MTLFPLGAVALLPGPFARAQQLDLAYLLSLDPDRLLAPLRREAGLPAVAESYGNWESSGLDGHTVGHVLSAAALFVAATADDRAEGLVVRLVDEIRACQVAGGTGYVGGIPHGTELWARVAAGEVHADSFGLNGAWVPWYNLHKLFAGLIDAYRYAGSRAALDVVVRLADWWCDASAGLTPAQLEAMLDTEFGAMTEAWADLAEITGSARYLAMAYAFCHRRTLDPLLERRDRLDSTHANTQIAKVLGYQRLAEVADDASLAGAARWFWERVVAERTFAFGGNSAREHFHPADDCRPALLTAEGPETCNTVNLLELSRLLLEQRVDEEVLGYVERILVNQLLSAQHPEHGGLVYFTPVRPDHYRVYSDAQECFWCCVGTGLEVHARHAELIWSHEADTVSLDLFVASRLHWADQQLVVELRDTLIDDDQLELVIIAAPAHPLTLQVRRPGWATSMTVMVSGRSDIDVDVQRDERAPRYVAVRRQWAAGDRMTVRIGREVVAEPLPDGSAWVAFRYGPVVLAARTGEVDAADLVADGERMGHVAAGPLRPLAELPIVSLEQGAAGLLRRRPGPELAFDLVHADDPAGRGLVFEPFHRVHDCRYAIYLPTASPTATQARRDELRQLDLAVLPLSAATIDVVAVGEQQPESDHAYVGAPDVSVGLSDGSRWRASDSWFGYRLCSGTETPTRLAVTVLDAPGEPTLTRLLLGGLELGVVAQSAAEAGRTVTLDVPASAVTGPFAEVRVHGHDGRASARVTEIRLLR